ncbi:syndecan-3-like isoform X1 [Etheostoma cragini]|uniref:syndecan-3-like isoform X1 n=1 Tax=Etheostoma cragini TaxID=417921 RepID=UPI00155E4A87|nr:syndecan-3-like isoform X1 [Etheostoma cragini]
MGISVSFLFLALGLLHPIHMSFPVLPGDLEGSGYDLDISGSGDWSQQGEMENIEYNPNSEDVRTFAGNAGGGTKTTLHDSSVLNFDGAHKDSGSGFVFVANSKGFLENKEVFTAVIAGGVTGVALAAALAALLIYKWQKKDNGGYILGQQRASDEDYHRPDREHVVV